jgi:hypothetical protein
MKNISFFYPIFLGQPKAEASASKASGCFMRGNPVVCKGGTGKAEAAKLHRTQELAQSSAQKKSAAEKG